MTRQEFEDKVKSLGNKKKFIVRNDGYIIMLNPVHSVSTTDVSWGSGWDLTRVEFDQISDVVDAYKQPGASVTFGSDPEFFFVDKQGRVIPSTKLLSNKTGIVKPDGFQGELNPSSSTCRQSAGHHIGDAIVRAADIAKKAGLQLSLDVGKIITYDIWKDSSTELKRFGCNPTYNAHEAQFKRVTGLREKFRAAGGHIHIATTVAKGDESTLITLMDILGGNTAVLIDRDENNARRRINYGRAGEYRIKSYGVEYRVYSNFWLKHYVLWSMASVLLRDAVAIYRDEALRKDLLSRVDIKKVREAINTNNKELAMETMLVVRDFFIENMIVKPSGLSAHNINTFIAWASEENPMARLRCQTVRESIDNWEHKRVGWADGFELFLQRYAEGRLNGLAE
jgi:hypothetical protein